ncbi:hypothetical protein DICPUDRAFT_155413 [Dictyostelium purpureum]|uniref:Uncharacterized protein n=1 Tax=Dictyostelium purpureum TaxID=5786 RepID=F0ZTY1_DICPU|nr:uncharacterized protein DICPUDRAFT_155413 [Dictyostelium purpureum]EGC32583.1 hypothetical protein DICPUDRAFT_155413 [Dictyostelium purpureum]|eukprot:XP_003290874.1 hypothetical protein DICPUDRAFT_155413 [Dictyostelium purpureum]
MNQSFLIKEDYMCLNNLISLKNENGAHHENYDTYLQYLEKRCDFLFKYYFDKNCKYYNRIDYYMLQIGEDVMEYFYNSSNSDTHSEGSSNEDLN